MTISATGLCSDCGLTNLATNLIGLTERRGPAWQRWRRAMAACVGAGLPDDYQPERQGDTANV